MSSLSAKANPALAAVAPAPTNGLESAPLLFFYTYLHDAIRSELDSLAQLVLHIENTNPGVQDLKTQLLHLRDRYRFLEQIYKYHSSVEDEVVYPALDSKVKNVTVAYSIEHEEEEHLLEELLQLLGKALHNGSSTTAPSTTNNSGTTLRQLARKVEEVHITLRKHLAKEEEQLLPLLLQHFTYKEQAELVAQFLCCIPLAAVEPVLTWLKQTVPIAEQTSLLHQVESAVSDELLQQLMVTWLEPKTPTPHRESSPLPSSPVGKNNSKKSNGFVCCRQGSGHSNKDTTAAAHGSVSGSAQNGTSNTAPPAACENDMEDTVVSTPGKPPLKEILYFHRAIRSALQSFAEEARALRASEGSVAPHQLTALVERHRFIRAVCLFHSSSEDEILFPALRRVVESQKLAAAAAGGVGVVADHEQDADHHHADEEEEARHRCEDDHEHENAKFEQLGRLLGDVKAYVRRGAKEVDSLVENLSEVADQLARAMSRHMTREESEVLPVLMRTLCSAEQRHMVWRIMQAMPLRLLERFMPWVANKLRAEDVQEWLRNIKQAAPPQDAPLVELLCQWAQRAPATDTGVHKQPKSSNAKYAGTGSDNPADFANQTCGPASFSLAAVIGGGVTAGAQDQSGQATAASAAAQQREGAVGGNIRPLKRIKTDTQEPAPTATNNTTATNRTHNHYISASRQVIDNPIDHIFQFHKALRRELKQLESSAVELQASADDAHEWDHTQLIQDLQARFQFLRGIYKAHSSAEDEIVFPALETKEALHNVSHSYTLDHKQEEELFEHVSKVIDQIGGCTASKDLMKLRALANQLARMCAAVRASLETHVRSEEKELWPLFAEHFTIEEQEHLVGVIIGRTGAEVLHSMLSWVADSLTPEEETAMMVSLKSATKSTAFEQWLDRAVGGGGASGSGIASSGGTAGAPTWQDERQEVLEEVANYLAQHGVVGGVLTNTTAGGVSGGAQTDKNAQQQTFSAASEGQQAVAAAALAAQLQHQQQPADPASLAADSTQFRPGWEDIFLMNQKQLESAVRRVSRDEKLEPKRKAYLIQHLMASRYIVAQQRRMRSLGSSAGVTPTAAVAAAGGFGGAAARTAMPPPPPLPPPPSTAAAQEKAHHHHHHHHACDHDQHDHRPYPGAAQQQQQQAPDATTAADAAAPSLGCRHYKRNCALVAPCCGHQHTCRLCHDEQSDHGDMDRYAVSEMVCLLCNTRQPVGQECTSCGHSMAKYYCGICHLFDNDPEREIYHCPFCNFCRRGKGLGVDSFHCMACNACMSLELFNKHECKEKALSGNCPVCKDLLFESKTPIKELPCGHFMHSLCFAAYTRYSYTCPVCCKSLGDMSVYWKMIDSLLASEELPAEYASRKQTILCNDCSTETEAAFHFVYHKCDSCGGYNTRIL